MNREDLTEEQREQFKNAKTPEEILDLAQKHGIDLSLDELEGVAGGANWNECEQDTYSGPY